MEAHNDGRKSMKRLSFSAPKDTDSAIAALAAEWGVSKSQAVNILLDRGLSIEAMTSNGGEIIYRHPETGDKVIYRPGVNYLNKISDAF